MPSSASWAPPGMGTAAHHIDRGYGIRVLSPPLGVSRFGHGAQLCAPPGDDLVGQAEVGVVVPPTFILVSICILVKPARTYRRTSSRARPWPRPPVSQQR